MKMSQPKHPRSGIDIARALSQAKDQVTKESLIELAMGCGLSEKNECLNEAHSDLNNRDELRDCITSPYVDALTLSNYIRRINLEIT